MGVSKNMGKPPNHPFVHRIFHYKPSILRYPYFWKHPYLTQPMDPEKKSLNFIFPTKHVIPESLKFSHWLSEV